MIQEVALRNGLRHLLNQTEPDIRRRVTDEPELRAKLKEQHQAAVAAGRAAAAGVQSFIDESITQAAVHWLLACVFVRFLEDNRLIDEAWISGPGERLKEAQERLSIFWQRRPTAGEGDYMLEVFETVAALPDMKDLFHKEHNPLWRLAPTGDQSKAILHFFWQKDQATGELLYDFTDPLWGTRFLGDLYQNLSDFAQRKYALRQTPQFILDFILDRTLTPAIDSFGVSAVRLIDPACGSGHFLISAFQRLFKRLSETDASLGSSVADLALSKVYGVDVNPFAIAVTRFRLLIEALKSCGIEGLRNAPKFTFHLAVGDSLLHGTRPDTTSVQRRLDQDTLEHYYQTEDQPLLGRILSQQYHAVVGNPPYINVDDDALRNAYRSRFRTCYGNYQLVAPFVERFFDLAVTCDTGTQCGYVGMIVANAFMWAKFGKRLIDDFLRHRNLTHVVDTSILELPEHGTTPTVILLGRAGLQIGETLRAVRGKRNRTRQSPIERNKVIWDQVLSCVDIPGTETEWMSISDAPRDSFRRHPWSMGGGGAAELREKIEDHSVRRLKAVVQDIGRTVVLGDEDAWFLGPSVAARERFGNTAACLVSGEDVRDWTIVSNDKVLYPYDALGGNVIQDLPAEVSRRLWPYRTLLRKRTVFGKTLKDQGKLWYEPLEHYISKLRAGRTIAFGEIATHNHFAYSAGGILFNRTAPIVQLLNSDSESKLFGLLGLLNSSVAGFWFRQVCKPKSGGTDWTNRFVFAVGKVENVPIPQVLPADLAELIAKLAADRSRSFSIDLDDMAPSESILEERRRLGEGCFHRMVALQEELDWKVYFLFRLLDEDLSLPPEEVPAIKPGQRPFEILMARQIAAGELESHWFQHNQIEPIVDMPVEWPERYRDAVGARLRLIGTNRDIALIEQPEYKRRWALSRNGRTTTWGDLRKAGLEHWLLNRLEAKNLWDSPELKSCAQLADVVRRDRDFVLVAEMYHPNKSISEVVAALVMKQSVPFLPVLRYKSSGVEKWSRWLEIWDLQRMEDDGQEVQALEGLDTPYFDAKDYLNDYWNLRGELDAPKERFILYPYLQRDADSTPVLAWAGWDHLKQAQALSAYYQHVKDEDGWDSQRLKPVLAGLLELIPWLKQWHNAEDPGTGQRMGDVFEAFVEGECQEFGFTVESVRDWTPPAAALTRGLTKRRGKGKG